MYEIHKIHSFVNFIYWCNSFSMKLITLFLIVCIYLLISQLGTYDTYIILNTVWYNITKFMGFMGSRENRKGIWSDFRI